MENNKLQEQIYKELSNDEIKNILIKIGNESHSVGRVSETIGDVYTYLIVHRDGEGLIDYLTQITDKYKECNGDSKTMVYERSKALAKSIAKKLNIPIGETGVTKEQENKIKQYFLKNYVEDGFVMHSFNGSAKESIEKNGFSSNKRVWDDNEILKIAEIFNDKGVLAPVGGYSHYSGKGIYVEYNSGMSFSHAVSGPEWFKWFTSADHNDNSQKIEESPYYLKDYEACKQNVEDLCNNSNISFEEQKIVSGFFEKMWDKMGRDDTYTALIPKKVIGKNDISKATIEGENAIQTIMTVLTDKNKEYIEHGGNCFEGKIDIKDAIVIKNPETKEIFGNRDYKRETKEELYDKDRLDNLKRKIESGRKILSSREKNPNVLNKIETKKNGLFGYFKKIYEKFRTKKHKTLPSSHEENIKTTFENKENSFQEELQGGIASDKELLKNTLEEKNMSLNEVQEKTDVEFNK